MTTASAKGFNPDGRVLEYAIGAEQTQPLPLDATTKGDGLREDVGQSPDWITRSQDG